MVDRSIKLCGGWNDGQRINMSEQIMSLTLMIVGESPVRSECRIRYSPDWQLGQ